MKLHGKQSFLYARTTELETTTYLVLDELTSKVFYEGILARNTLKKKKSKTTFMRGEREGARGREEIPMRSCREVGGGLV